MTAGLDVRRERAILHQLDMAVDFMPSAQPSLIRSLLQS
jgi:hypothetical protein